MITDRRIQHAKLFKKHSRGRGRGRGQRYQPYLRRHDEEDNRLPRPTPDHLLSGDTSQEKTTARDDLRLANDWKVYFQKYFERERYRLPRPTDSHRVPDADTLNAKLDGILDSTKTQCKEAIEEHLNSVVIQAENRVKNQPKPAEANLVEEVSKLVKQTEQKWESIMQHMGRTMYGVLEQRETQKKQEDLQRQPDQPDN